MVSDITNKLLPEIEEWQKQPIASVYPIAFIDTVHFSARDNCVIRKLLLTQPWRSTTKVAKMFYLSRSEKMKAANIGLAS